MGWDVVGLVPRAGLGLCLLLDHAEREAFLHSPPVIVATATLDQFAHSLSPTDGPCQALTDTSSCCHYLPVKKTSCLGFCSWHKHPSGKTNTFHIKGIANQNEKHENHHKCHALCRESFVPHNNDYHVTLHWHFVQMISVKFLLENSCCHIV